MSAPFSAIRMVRLPASWARAITALASSCMVEEKRTMEPCQASIALNSRAESSHWATMRISSSRARTRAAPARKMAWLSARMIRFIGLDLLWLCFSARPLIGGFARREGNVYNSDSGLASPGGASHRLDITHLSEPSGPERNQMNQPRLIRDILRGSNARDQMPKPILLAIDDDTSVLEAVVQDLRRHYGQNYRIVRAASGGRRWISAAS